MWLVQSFFSCASISYPPSDSDIQNQLRKINAATLATNVLIWVLWLHLHVPNGFDILKNYLVLDPPECPNHHIHHRDPQFFCQNHGNVPPAKIQRTHMDCLGYTISIPTTRNMLSKISMKKGQEKNKCSIDSVSSMQKVHLVSPCDRLLILLSLSFVFKRFIVTNHISNSSLGAPYPSKLRC